MLKYIISSDIKTLVVSTNEFMQAVNSYDTDIELIVKNIIFECNSTKFSNTFENTKC